MTDGAKQLVEVLKDNAEWCKRNNELGPYLTLGGCMALAADLIKNLSADLERDERQYGRDAFATLVDEGVKLEAERDAWKRRCEAAERELKTLRPCYCCKYYRKELAESGEESDPVCGEDCFIASKWQWRGPCKENGGKHEQDTPHATENG